MPTSVVENGQIKCPFNLRTDLPIILNPELVPGDQFYCHGCVRRCLLQYLENPRESLNWSRLFYVEYRSGFSEHPLPSVVLPRGSAKDDPHLIIR